MSDYNPDGTLNLSNNNLSVYNDEEERVEEEEKDEENECQSFDVDIVDKHTYIFSGAGVELTNVSYYAEGSISSFPLLYSENIIFPGQSMPLIVKCPFSKEIYERIYNSGKVAVLTISGRNINPEEISYFQPHINAVLVKVTRLERNQIENSNSILVEMTATQRCLIIEKKLGSCTAKILSEHLLPCIPTHVLPSNFLRRSKRDKIQFTSQLIDHPKFMIHNTTKTKCENLVKYFSNWFEEKKIRNILEILGETVFSFWVCTNMMATELEKYKLLCEDSTDRRIEKLYEIIKERKIFLCNNCSTFLFSLDDVIKMNGNNLNRYFVNPGGFNHELLTTSKVTNFVREGEKTSEFCWFPGYDWQIILCSNCRTHFGWEYTSNRLIPKQFYGITSTAIRPATWEKKRILKDEETTEDEEEEEDD